jgi:hypothetical protein
MTKTVALAVSCSCKEKKQFIYSVQVEQLQHGDEADSIVIECPFKHESNCCEYISLQLPAGMKPQKTGTVLKN